MNESPKEMEFRKVVRGLDESGKDRVLDAARAMAYAWKSMKLENREPVCPQPKQAILPYLLVKGL
jgi:hypothetical protein